MYLGCCCDVSQGPVGGTGINGFPGLRVSNSFAIIFFFYIYVPCFPCKIDIMINPLFKFTVLLLSLLVLVACPLSAYLLCFCGSSIFTTVTDDHQ